MKALRCLIVVALLIVAAPALAADAGDPASILPQDAFFVVRLEKAGAQMALSTFAMPPAAKMFDPKMVSPFSYVNEMLLLPVGTVEKIVPHVTGATLAALPDRDIDDEPLFVFIISFDNARWPRELLTKVPKGRLFDGHAAAIGQHIIFCEKNDHIARLRIANFPTLATSPHYLAARRLAAGSLLWAATSVPDLVRTVRAKSDRDKLTNIDAVAKLLGLDHMTYALLTVKHVDTRLTAEITVGMDGRPDTSIISLLPVDKITAGAPTPGDAAIKLALNWGDAAKFFGGIRDRIKATAEILDPGDDDFAQGVAQIEKIIGVPLDALFTQIGGGVSAFLLPPDKHGMIAREDWAVVLPLKKSEAFKTSLHNMFMAVRGGDVPPPTDLGGLAVLPMPDAPAFYAVTPDALVVSGSAANVKRAAELKKVPTEALAMLHLDAGRLMASYPQPVPDTLVLNMALTRTPTQLKLTAKLDGLPEGKALKQMLLPASSLLATSILPELERARKRARQAADKNNLHQIGILIEVYRQEHNAQYPPTLKALVDKKYTEDLTLFIAPGDENPPVVNGLKCSYVYIGTPLPKKIPSATIICYTRAGVFRRLHNILYADYTASSTWGGNGGPLRNPRNRKGDFPIITKLLGPALTEARKKELAKFYGVRVTKVPPVRRPVRPPVRPPGGGERDFPLPPDR